MKVLVLITENRLPNNDLMYMSLAKHANVSVVKLSSEQQENMASVVKSIDFKRYDRVVLDLLFKRIYKQPQVIRQIPNLLIYDMDICQNYIASSRWHGKFSSFYKQLEMVRVVSSGASVAARLRPEGFDVQWLKKGFDEKNIYQENVKRDIELGFIGRVKSSAYSERLTLLESLQQDENLQMLRTQPGEEYRRTLSRIQYFISSDIGLGEYMAKNFEAMACGCVLFAYRQGGGEEEALGLKDMGNVVLYHDISELKEKLSYLRDHSEISTKIAENGQKLAFSTYTFSQLGDRLYDIIKQPIPANKSPNFIDKARISLSRSVNLGITEFNC